MFTRGALYYRFLTLQGKKFLKNYITQKGAAVMVELFHTFLFYFLCFMI